MFTHSMINLAEELENILFMHLRRRHSRIYYHKFRFECDYLVMNKGRIESAVQVCRSLDEPETLKRELRGLLDAMQMHKLSEGFIITEDNEETIIENGSTVHVIPAWKYLLAEELNSYIRNIICFYFVK